MHVPVNRVFNNVSRNLGLKNFTENLDSWAEWAFEAEQYIGSNKTFLQKEIVYSTEATAATATIEIDTNPSDMSYIDVNGTRFYFVDPDNIVLNDDFYIEIKASVFLTLIEAVNVLNASHYENLQEISASTSGTTLTLTCLEKGDRGNHFTLESDVFKISKFFSGGKEKIDNKQIRLPDNMVKLINIRTGNTILEPTSSQFKSSVSDLLNRYYTNGNRVNFSKDYTSDITVSYLTVPLSVEGYPMILQGHEEAVAHYIMWKHKLIDYYAGEVPQYIVKDLEKRWYYLCGKVRGDDNMPTSIELLKIGKIWNAKVPITSHNPPLYDGLNSY